MPVRFLSLLACVSLLVGCQSFTLPSEQGRAPSLSGISVDPQKAEVEAIARSRVLEAWWVFFEDDVLERLVVSALRFMHFDKKDEAQLTISDVSAVGAVDPFEAKLDPAVDIIHDIAQKYLSYRFLQNKDTLLTSYITARHEISSRWEEEYPKTVQDPRLSHISKSLDDLLGERRKMAKEMGRIVTDLAVSTRLMPEYIEQRVRKSEAVPQAQITPILASDMSVIAYAPAILEAQERLVHALGDQVSLGEVMQIFPKSAISSFFGIGDDVYVNNDERFRLKAGVAIRKLKLEGLEQRFGTTAAYVDFRDRIFDSLMTIERLLVSYMQMQEQHSVLEQGVERAQQEYKALEQYSRHYAQSYAGLVSMRADVYKAQQAVLYSEHERAKLLIDLYQFLGVY